MNPTISPGCRDSEQLAPGHAGIVSEQGPEPDAQARAEGASPVPAPQRLPRREANPGDSRPAFCGAGGPPPGLAWAGASPAGARGNPQKLPWRLGEGGGGTWLFVE